MSETATSEDITSTPSSPPLLKFIILIPSMISFVTSLILAIIITAYRSKQTTLSKFVFCIALSDLLYTFMGIFFTFEKYFQKCPSFLSSTREYTRLVTCGLTIAFALTTSFLAKTRKTDTSKNFMNKSFLFILGTPLLFIMIFLIFYPHEYLDILCWYDIKPEESLGRGRIIHVLQAPLLITFLTTFIIYTGIIVFIKKQMAREGNFRISNNLYELFVYPLGILICYIWFFFDGFDSSYDFIRMIGIFSQQLQGTVNFFIYGMNYQTRTQLKDYWSRISGRMYEFLHLQEKEKEVELQNVPFNTEYVNQDKFQTVQYV